MKNILVIAALIFNATQLSAGDFIRATGGMVSAIGGGISAAGNIVNAAGGGPAGPIISASGYAVTAGGGVISASAGVVDCLVNTISVLFCTRLGPEEDDCMVLQEDEIEDKLSELPPTQTVIIYHIKRD